VAVPRETDRVPSAISSRRSARSQGEDAGIQPAVPIQGCPDEPHRQTAFRSTLEYLSGPSTIDRCGPTSRQRRPVRLGHQSRHRRAAGDPALGRQDPALDRSSAAHSKARAPLMPTPAPTSRSPPTGTAPCDAEGASPLCLLCALRGSLLGGEFGGGSQAGIFSCPDQRVPAAVGLGRASHSRLPLGLLTRPAAVGPRPLVSRETRRHRRPIADGAHGIGLVGPVHRKRVRESGEACA